MSKISRTAFFLLLFSVFFSFSFSFVFFAEKQQQTKQKTLQVYQCAPRHNYIFIRITFLHRENLHVHVHALVRRRAFIPKKTTKQNNLLQRPTTAAARADVLIKAWWFTNKSRLHGRTVQVRWSLSRDLKKQHSAAEES